MCCCVEQLVAWQSNRFFYESVESRTNKPLFNLKFLLFPWYEICNRREGGVWMDKRQPESIHTYKICPKCKYFCSTREKDEYCSLCGEKLLTLCKKCNSEINNPYAHFCRICGEKFPGRGQQKLNYQ